MENLYKVKNPQHLYSTGGQNLKWNRVGKTWDGLSSFACHLAYITSEAEKLSTQPRSLFNIYGDCFVEEISVSENGTSTSQLIPFKKWFDEYTKKSKKYKGCVGNWQKEDVSAVQGMLKNSNAKLIGMKVFEATGEAYCGFELNGKKFAIVRF